MTSTDVDTGTLWRTTEGTRAHLRRCPHLVDEDLVPAGTDLSRAEFEGRGREYVEDRAAAVPVIGVAGSDWKQVHQLLSAVARLGLTARARR